MKALVAESPNDPLDNEAGFLDWIHEQTGLHLQSHQLPGFRQGVREACERFGTASATGFFERVRQSPIDSPERHFLIARITVGETYFNRIPDQIRFLREHWLPETIERKRAAGNLSLRIWSAACSGGEELYTMAILLRELLPDIRNWSLHLVGTDINPDAIAKARDGIYSAWSLRTMPPNDIPLYFDRRGKHFELHRNIREMAQFSILNLARDIYPSLSAGICAMDLILCRNVFIYFTQPVIEPIMARFADTLADDACLMLAPSDLVEQRYPGLRLICRPGVFYYERGSPEELALQHDEALPDVLPVADFAALPASVDIAPAPAAQPCPTAQPAILSHDETNHLAEALEALEDHRWQAALEAAQRRVAAAPEDARGYWLLAAARSALGESDAAQADCRRGLEIAPLAPELHHLHAMLLLDRDDHRAAEAGFKRAVYLDWERAESHFQLSMLKASRHNFKAARKHMQDALAVAVRQPADAKLPPPSDMRYGRLVDILNTEIAAFERRHDQRLVA